MCQIKVNGGRPLQGALTVQGSKNAALPILAASILHEGVSVLHNCPRISDVNTMIQILESLGCSVRWERDALIIDASGVSRCQIERECAAKMRSSVLLLGALLGRFGECKISYPGGCVIGKRPIDLHLRGLSALGWRFGRSRAMCTAKGGRGEVIFAFRFAVWARQKTFFWRRSAPKASPCSRDVHGSRRFRRFVRF